MPSRDDPARDPQARAPGAPRETPRGRRSLLGQLRDANEQLVISSMRTQLSLAERLRFEKLLSSLSDAFSHLSVGDFDREIQSGLRQVVDFLEVDRAGLIEFSRDGRIARSWATEEWMDMGAFPWVTARLQRGDVIDFSQIEGLGDDEAAVDRQSYLTLPVKPQMAVPLRAGAAVVGGLVCSPVAAERPGSGDELMQQLQILGEVFGHALWRKQGELEAERLRQELTHIGRVSVLGEFAASMAHELNQPLAAILYNTQAALRLLGAGVVNLEELREILKDIEADDKRAGDLIRRLRGLIQKGGPEFVLLDLNEIIGEVMWLVRNDAALRNVPLRLELAAGVPRVRGDRVQLQQLVLNLVLNGLEAMPESCKGDRTLVIRTARDHAAGDVTVAVEDSGVGIDDKDVGHIFEPFYTTKAGGLGMGLAIARSIVDAHGGRLGAVNNAHGGATIQFTLPAGPEDER